MKSRLLKSTQILILALVALLPVAMMAQDTTKSASKVSAQGSDSRWDIFAGYSYLKPHASVSSEGVSYNFSGINAGAIGSISYYFNKNLGLQFEGDVHSMNETLTGTNNDLSGGSAGIIYRIPHGNLTPFIHALVGGERGAFVDSTEQWGPVVTAGGGFDWEITKHIAWRVVQADYQFIHEDFDHIDQSSSNINALRLSSGIVFHVGEVTPPPAVTIACSANPTSIYAGDPVAVTATAGDLNPKWNAIYSWSGEGVTGNGTSASVATASLAPGTYTVKCGVKEGKPGKEGLKPGQSAEGTTSFTVKAFEPPTISCATSQTTIKPGETAAITATAVSPQNRPLTYSYSASAGSVSGNGNTATFNSTGAPTGAVEVTCSVSDDKGHSVSANTSLNIVAPYVPPAPHTQALCSITFDKDLKRPTRVDNEAKACLDEVALSLQKQSDAKAVVVGSADAKEKEAQAKKEKIEAKKKHPKPVVDMAAQRAVNAKEYLVTDKGIDASRVSAATTTTDGQKVEDYLVPAGATFGSDVQGTTSVDETMVKAEVRKPLPERHHAKKAAKK